MNILEKGKIPKFILKCKHCQTKFEYQLSEVKHNGIFHGGVEYLSIECPLCQISQGWMDGTQVANL
jgi:hypothetical protein